MTDSPAQRWVEEHVNIGTIQTIVFGGAMLALGVWFGNQITGRLAATDWPVTALGSGGPPEWVATVKMVNWVALGVFALGILAVLVLDAIGKEP